MKLFTDPNVPFAMGKPWCSYLYMNGIIDRAPAPDGVEMQSDVCRFSSPFVQRRLFSGFTSDMFGDKGPLPAIEIGDWLDDVFTSTGLCVPKLLERYRDYLKRLREKNIDPWVGQPRRADLHYTEAVGHFHLYAWLQNAIGRRCAISPEFPTGNGKVDLVLRTKEHTAVLEVKSFGQMWELPLMRGQAARYAKKLGAQRINAGGVCSDGRRFGPRKIGQRSGCGRRVCDNCALWVGVALLASGGAEVSSASSEPPYLFAFIPDPSIRVSVVCRERQSSPAVNRARVRRLLDIVPGVRKSRRASRFPP